MAVISLRLPTDEEQELRRRFVVNQNYLRALANFLEYRYGAAEDMYRGIANRLAAHPPYLQTQRSKSPVPDDVRRFLTLAWVSEAQLHLPLYLGSSSTMAFTNAWAPVHAYYATFGGLQAWFGANGLTGTADDHSASLRTIANMLHQRHLFPEPWCLLAIGCPMRGEKKFLGAPAGARTDLRVEVLSKPAPFGHDGLFWSRYGIWLGSTRRGRLEAREAEWKRRHKRARIPPKERDRIAAGLSPTSLFDCLWRLRVRANYGNVDPYLVALIDEQEHAAFLQSLAAVVRATLAIIELYLIRRIGAPAFRDLAEDFVASDGAGISKMTLQARVAAY